jgi:hypothetical protein
MLKHKMSLRNNCLLTNLKKIPKNDERYNILLTIQCREYDRSDNSHMFI